MRGIHFLLVGSHYLQTDVLAHVKIESSTSDVSIMMPKAALFISY
jgi:hypothetical protein